MDTLNGLLARERELSSHIVEMQDSLSTVRVRIAEILNLNRTAGTYNLPNETLSAIFEAGLFETPSPSKDVRQNWYLLEDESLGPPFEILVSSVSRRWRNVALHTPRLWTVLEIDVGCSTHDLLDLYLRRSKACLLDITLLNLTPTTQLPLDSNAGSDPNLKECLDRLIPHVERWRKLVISNGTVRSPAAVFSALTPVCAPALETLVLNFSGSKRPMMDLFSGGAPRLSTVELTGVYFVPPPNAVKFAKLRTGRNFWLNYAEMSQIILPMRSLLHLQMDSKIVADDAAVPANHALIELPSLLSLDIYIIDTVGPLRFLDLPKVRILTIRGCFSTIINALAQHRHIYPRVRSLKLVAEYDYNYDTSASAVLDMISCFPNIRDITFQGADPTHILNILHDHKRTDDLPWPHLSAITVKAAIGAKVASKKQMWACVVKVVDNRRQLGIPISQLKLSSQIVERGTERQKQRLKELVILTEC
jgi:hypothetical protein